MTNLALTATTSSPEVLAEAETGLLRVSGESYPANAFAFYQPVLDWVTAFLQSTELPVTVEIALTYLNTSSVKSLMDLLDLLEEAHRGGRRVSVTWFCDEDNDRAEEMAQEFQEEVTLPFAIVSRPAAG